MTVLAITVGFIAVFLALVLAYVGNRFKDFVKHMTQYINDRQCDVLSNPTLSGGRDRYDELRLVQAKFREYVKHAKVVPWKH